MVGVVTAVAAVATAATAGAAGAAWTARAAASEAARDTARKSCITGSALLAPTPAPTTAPPPVDARADANASAAVDFELEFEIESVERDDKGDGADEGVRRRGGSGVRRGATFGVSTSPIDSWRSATTKKRSIWAEGADEGRIFERIVRDTRMKVIRVKERKQQIG
jgi:hypothetical protein